MRRTKVKAIVAVIVTLALAVTGAVLGYHKGRSASATSAGLAATDPHAAVPEPHPAVPESYAVPRQIPVLCFHGIGTPSPVPRSVGNYNTTLDNFTAEMAYLYRQGYATITPQQYANWLNGIKQLLPAKPILLTFDGPFVSDTQATPVLEKYGFNAVLFVITGYANGDYGSTYAGWSTIQAMASEGWMIQLHAGECGHAFLPYAPPSCLAGLDRSLMTPADYQYYIWPFGQTSAQYEARVTDDITAGQAAIQAHLGFPAGWQSTVFAAPFGAWGNGQDPWLISYWDSIFKTIFVQYIAASDQAAAHADHVRYRLELGYAAQSAAYLASHLSNPAFTRAGAGSGITTGSSANENAASG
jgi:peptidoglycan/xylan/chitin deacetylase (PgdA/CDA1 family)